jgi:hypothetical protein
MMRLSRLGITLKSGQIAQLKMCLPMISSVAAVA